jgi:hypothetical protein
MILPTIFLLLNLLLPLTIFSHNSTTSSSTTSMRTHLHTKSPDDLTHPQLNAIGLASDLSLLGYPPTSFSVPSNTPRNLLAWLTLNA